MNQVSDIDIAQVIQLAIAPVFLLVALGNLINVMTTRLGRVIDRARQLEVELLGNNRPELQPMLVAELSGLDRRMAYANRAINLAAASALLVSCVVAVLFAGHVFGVNSTALVSGLFIVATLLIILAICFFMAEIAIATRTLRVRADLLRQKE
jgi:hypothetical protein